MGAGSKGCCPSKRQGGRADVSRAAQSPLCSLATDWALHTGGRDAHFLGCPSGITACAPGEAPGCFGLEQRFEEIFTNPGDGHLLGSRMCPQCGSSWQMHGSNFLVAQAGGTSLVLSALLLTPGWEMAENSRATAEGLMCAGKGGFVPTNWAQWVSSDTSSRHGMVGGH